jgi:hypothetical protein
MIDQVNEDGFSLRIEVAGERAKEIGERDKNLIMGMNRLLALIIKGTDRHGAEVAVPSGLILMAASSAIGSTIKACEQERREAANDSGN